MVTLLALNEGCSCGEQRPFGPSHSLWERGGLGMSLLMAFLLN